jgi:hypothetical protein
MGFGSSSLKYRTSGRERSENYAKDAKKKYKIFFFLVSVSRNFRVFRDRKFVFDVLKNSIQIPRPLAAAWVAFAGQSWLVCGHCDAH